MSSTKFFISVFSLFCAAFAYSQSEQSYVISKDEVYTFTLKNNSPLVVLNATERKFVGDKNNRLVLGKRIPFQASFEEVSDIEAYAILPDKRKSKITSVSTEDVMREDIFHHDSKFKYFYYKSLENGSETFTSYKKTFNKAEFLPSYYFRNELDCKQSSVSLKVLSGIEVGYILRGNDTDKVEFSTTKDGDYTVYKWQLNDQKKDETFDDAPDFSYYSPHLIFYIKNYTTNSTKNEWLGSVPNLYKMYAKTISKINQTNQNEVKIQTENLIAGLNSDYEKAQAVFNFVQSKINYVAFEDGMGGFIPRDAADVLQKKYGDCKDMANLLTEMLKYAKIDAHLAWIGTRDRNYTYQDVPSPIVDNHMICNAKLNGSDYFLDATDSYVIFPKPSVFIQGKEAMVQLTPEDFSVISVPVSTPEENTTDAKILYKLTNNNIEGTSKISLLGYNKSDLVQQYKSASDKGEFLKNYSSRYIQNKNSSAITIANDDLSAKPVEINYDFKLEKWVKAMDEQIMFKPILFFPFSDYKIDAKRKVPVEFRFGKSFTYHYEIDLPEGYKTEFLPENFALKNKLMEGTVHYTSKGNKILVAQSLSVFPLLVEEADFELWNNSIKALTKTYNQNIIFSK